MNDRELLELAAKAARMNVELVSQYGVSELFDNDEHREWNPLTNDGDAIRLAVKLGMKDCFGLVPQDNCVQTCTFSQWETIVYEDFEKQDPHAETRRAIVRAAAEFGAKL